jgi:hypothetical protein
VSATLGEVNRLRVAAVSVRYPVATRSVEWELPEGTVPESAVHDAACKHLVLLLDAWAAMSGADAMIVRNLAVRWLEEQPKVGVDPDVCVLRPPPPERELVDSIRLWLEGHEPPPVCFEVVSKNHPYKDYGDVHERYAAMGTQELFVFDPLLAGPRSLGGPVRLQVWRRDPTGVLERAYFGPGPAYSEVLRVWVFVKEHKLALALDREGEQQLHTLEEKERAEKERERSEKERERSEKERERAEKERERAEKERERAARIELEGRVAELERKLR